MDAYKETVLVLSWWAIPIYVLGLSREISLRFLGSKLDINMSFAAREGLWIHVNVNFISNYEIHRLLHRVLTPMRSGGC
jgi:hypothetical protein